jgi:uncharacterized membrane protein
MINHMFFLIEIIIFVVIAVSLSSLSKRVRELEKKAGVLPQSSPVRPVATPVSAVAESAAPAPSMSSAAAPIELKPATPTTGESFAAWIKEDWLVKLGAFMLLLGFSWLTTYAFMNNWIGPVGRIVLGIVAGCAFMGFGFYRMRQYVKQGGIFLVLGSATVILTIFAARVTYDFFTPFSALGIMFLAAAFVALASVRYRVQSLALISMVLAGLTPILIHSGQINDVGLFSYLLLMTLGTVWVVAITGWRSLVFAALMIVSMYSVSFWIFGSLQTTSPLMMFAFAFAALFFVVGILGILKSSVKDRKADLLVAAGNGIFLLLWIKCGILPEWQTLIISAWMIVFAGGGFMVFRATRQPAPFLLYAGVATMFLAAATAIQLEGAALVIAFTIEAAVIPLLVYYLVRDLVLAESTGLLLIAPLILSAPYVLRVLSWDSSSSFARSVSVLLVVAAALFSIGLFFRSRRAESVSPLVLHNGYIVAGLVFLYIIIWGGFHYFVPIGDVATMMSLVTYTLIGLSTYFYGKLNDAKAAKTHGGILLGFVVGRLLLIEVWDMEMGGRIITFFLVGALLMATAFIGRKKKITTTF